MNTLEHVQLPSSLQALTFQNRFNQTIERVILPEKLEVLSFGFRFNQSLEHVNLPATLRSLTFGHNFNQDLCLGPRWMGRFDMFSLNSKDFVGPNFFVSENVGFGVLGDVPGYVGNSLLFNLIFAILNFFRLRVRFPSGLETLAFGHDFAQSLVLLANHSFSVSFILLDRMYLVCVYQHLKPLSWSYLWSKVGVSLPSQLMHLTLGNDFSHSLEGITWPSTLKTLVLGRVPQLHFIKWSVFLWLVFLSW